MEPIAAALEGFDLTYILAAGGAVIVFVIAYVGIDKVKELIGEAAYDESEEQDSYDSSTLPSYAERYEYEAREDAAREADNYEYEMRMNGYVVNGEGIWQKEEEIENERYEHYVMSRLVGDENLSESDFERRAGYEWKYGSAGDFSEDDQARYTARFENEFGGDEFSFDDDD